MRLDPPENPPGNPPALKQWANGLVLQTRPHRLSVHPPRTLLGLVRADRAGRLVSPDALEVSA